MRAYGWLLRLLSRARRERFGDDMARVFDEQRQAARRRGPIGLARVWLEEIAGIMRVALKDRLARTGARLGPGGPNGFRMLVELRWAWRGIRTRGWRAALIVGLLAVALAANALLFAVADSLVFNRLPYRDAERLVRLIARQPSVSYVSDVLVSPAQLAELRGRTGVFSATHAYFSGRYTFVFDADAAAPEVTAFVTPGLIEMLGWRPLLGRPLTAADALDTEVRVALISETLARERFGDPSRAIGQLLTTSEEPLRVIGVMPRTFAFPGGKERIWRPLDAQYDSVGSMQFIGQLAPGVSALAATASLAPLQQALLTRGVPSDGQLIAAPLRNAGATDDQRRLMSLLLGAAACLLLIACANVASLELTTSMNRARGYAIQMALGGSRSGLIRTAATEGAVLVGAASIGGVLLSWMTLDTLVAWLPESERNFTSNPVHIDARAFAFMAGIAALTWMVSTLPIAHFASKPNVLQLLTQEGRTATASRTGTRVRQALTVLQTAVAVLLLIGSVLAVRSYRALLAIDKGFDPSRMLAIQLTLPTSTYSVPGALASLRNRLRETLTQHPSVDAFTSTTSFVDAGTSSTSHLQADGQAPLPDETHVVARQVDGSFFATLAPRLLRGRFLVANDLPTNVVIDDALARRLWPDTEALGRQFRTGSDSPWLTVVGLIGRIRYASESPLNPARTDTYGRYAEIYSAQQPPAPRAVSPAAARAPVAASAPPAPRPNAPRPGATFMFLNYSVRLRPGAGPGDLNRIIRALDSTFELTIAPIDDAYAKTFADKLLAARIVSGFGVLACLIAAAGIYSVISCVVAGRTREIGIRMALGATRADVRQLVLGSGLRLVMSGTVVGLGAAGALSCWVRSQVYGVSAVDPITYGLVALSISALAMLAIWQPSRHASRLDPAITLRAE